VVRALVVYRCDLDLIPSRAVCELRLSDVLFSLSGFSGFPPSSKIDQHSKSSVESL